MSPLTIAVVSDIHIGAKARSQDLVPSGASSKKRDEDFVAAFERFVAAHSLTADYLIIAGDISTVASSDEFLHASNIGQRLASALSVAFENILFVPGNHDVDWSVLGLAVGSGPANRELRWEQRYDPLLRTSNLFKMRVESTVTSSFRGDLFKLPFAGIWGDNRTTFAAINTSAHDCPVEPIHHGLVRDETVHWLRENLCSRVAGDEGLRTLILHHHLIPHGNMGREARDFSVCQNADHLLDVVREFDFDMVVHGHKHQPRFEINLVRSDHPVIVLGAGSFSADLSEEYGSGVQNQFHLISIEGRNSDSTRVYGILRNWAYVFPNGWAENKKTFTVVDHQIGFGGPLSWKDLARKLNGPIKSRSRGPKPFELSDIGPAAHQLKFVSPETARLAVEHVAKLQKLQVAWIDHSIPSAFIK